MTINSTLFYKELGKHAAEVGELMKSDNTVIPRLREASHTLIWLAETVRNEGLLWFEEAMNTTRVSEVVLSNELKKLMLLVVDGTEPELVENIAFKRYFTRNYTGLEGFLFLVYLDALLGIQVGELMHTYKEELIAVMPDEIGKEIENE